MSTKNRISVRLAATGLARGPAAVTSLVAVAFLAACGDRPGDRTVVGSRPAPMTPVSSQPSPDGVIPAVAPATPTEPILPPTPEEARAAWREGVTLYESGDFESAVPHLEVAAQGRPDDPYAQYLLGLAQWKSGHLEESEAALLRSAGLDDRSERTFVNLARVRLDRKDPRGALEAADRALSLQPGSAQGLHQRARALDHLNRGDEARDALRQARTADPENGYIANTLGYLLLRQGRTSEAVVELEAARESLPAVSYVRNNLGVAYERLGEVDKAVAEFQAAVEAGDRDGKAAASLARLEPVRERLMAGRPKEDGEPATSQETLADSGTDPEPPNR